MSPKSNYNALSPRRERVAEGRVRVMDGAMGTMLLAHGVPLQSCLEELNETRPALIAEIHRSYLLAGAAILVTNTFGANRLRLGSRANRLESLNRRGVQIAKKVAGQARVFASIGPLGKSSRKMSPKEMISLFREQVKSLEKEKPNGYLVETMTSLNEAEAAARAVREATDRKLLVSMSFPRGIPRNKEALFELISTTLRAAGATAIGINCGFHPEEAFNFLNLFRLVDPGPWMARPAAGLPTRPVFPEEFAKWGARIAALGVQYIGGCCHSTPAHLRVLKEKLG